MIKRIHVRYHLEVDPDADREAIDRAHTHHPDHCPVARTITPCVEVSTELELVERGA